MTDKSYEKKGKGNRKCRFCSNSNAVIRKYGLYTCRQCFVELSKDLGFLKYN